MATKRMFSRDIVQSDAFLDMPTSTQALYFQLGMEADDDGFIGNPKKVVRVLSCSEDDMKILIGKKFVLVFPSGVLVVKHHRINNNWDKHNNKRTVYLDEFSQLNIKENRAYTLDKTQGIPVQSDSSLETVWKQSLEEKRREEKSMGVAKATHPLLEVREVRIDTEGKEKQPKKKRESDPAWPLFQKTTAMLSKCAGFPVLTAEKDFVRLKEAMKSLKEKDVIGLVESEIESGWADKVGYSLAAMLTNSRINKYKADWNV